MAASLATVLAELAEWTKLVKAIAVVWSPLYWMQMDSATARETSFISSKIYNVYANQSYFLIVI